MRRELEHAVEDERATLEETVAPIPAIVLDDIMCLKFDPEIDHH